MDYRNFTIILPTINEAGAVGRLIDYICGHYHGARVIVADDGSSDGTVGMVKGIARRKKNIMLLDRKALRREKGLTASIVDGIGLSRTKFAIVMDADMQHPPQKISEMAKALEDGSDLVVATRATVEGWELNRKIVSKLLIWVGYFVLLAGGAERCRDIFSGYFGVDRKLFMEVYSSNRERFVPGGYKVLFDFLKCAEKGSLKIREVPFAFQVRKVGKSKAGPKQAFALLRSFFT